jgi:pSer/pThr/pTyr-binding forkhead associated (FHA) protein
VPPMGGNVEAAEVPPLVGVAPGTLCPGCRRPARSDESFCPDCGQPLGQVRSAGMVAPHKHADVPVLSTVEFPSFGPPIVTQPAPPQPAFLPHPPVVEPVMAHAASAQPVGSPSASPYPAAVPAELRSGPPRGDWVASGVGFCPAPVPAPEPSPLAQPAPAGPSHPPAPVTARRAFDAPRLELDALPPAVPSPSPVDRVADPIAPPAQGGYLVVVAPDGGPGRAFPLSEGKIDLGRAEVTITLAGDPFVCPRHARLHVGRGRYTIQDLGSVNGIYLRLTTPVVLQPGDSILVGLQVLCFHPIPQAENGYGDAVSGGTTLLGSPNRPRYARLVETTTEGVPRSVYVLGREETVLGRELGDIVFPADPFMSRRHAALRRNPSDATFTLEDLGSSNGTYLRIRGRADLAGGDHFRIGQHLLRLEVDGGQAEAR